MTENLFLFYVGKYTDVVIKGISALYQIILQLNIIEIINRYDRFF